MKKPKDSPKGYQKPVLSINAKSRDPLKDTHRKHPGVE
jgi:hypothetical protein